MDITIVIVGLVALAVGFGVAKLMEAKRANTVIKQARKVARKKIEEGKRKGEQIKKDKILQAKEKFIELKAEHEKVILSRDKKLEEAEKRIRDKESRVSSELDRNKKLNKDLDIQQKQYENKNEALSKKQEELDRMHNQQVEQLESISGLSAEDAKVQLVASLKDEAKADAMSYPNYFGGG